MKKLLLSSIIMLGVCGIAAAQTDSKVQKHPAKTTSTNATAQKAAFTTASDAAPVAPVAVNDDGTVAPAAAKTAPVTKAEAVAASVKTDDLLSADEQAKLKEEKLAKANEAPKKIGKKQN